MPADRITIPTPDTKQFPIHPDGQHPMLCVDVIDLGSKVEQYQNNPARIVPKCAIVWASGIVDDDSGELLTVSRELTVTMGENSAGVPSALRALLGQWRGKEYSPDEAKNPPPMHELEGVPALVTISHKPNKAGTRVYANVLSVAKCPAKLVEDIGDVSGYQRGKWWADKKAAYAEEVAKHNASKRPAKPQPPAEDWEELPPRDDDANALPF
jgi:hypothetical protein